VEQALQPGDAPSGLPFCEYADYPGPVRGEEHFLFDGLIWRFVAVSTLHHRSDSDLGNISVLWADIQPEKIDSLLKARSLMAASFRAY
jgi:hypothetical protein